MNNYNFERYITRRSRVAVLGEINLRPVDPTTFCCPLMNTIVGPPLDNKSGIGDLRIV